MVPSHKHLGLMLLLLLCGVGLAEAGKGSHRGGRPGHHHSDEKHGHYQHGRSREYAYLPRRGDSRPKSKDRRRRKGSKSRSSSAGRRTSKAEKPSPGYVEYKRQKQEAACQQERRLQAQAIAAVLEEREMHRQAANLAAVGQMQGVPPLPGAQGQAQAQVPMPGQALWQHAPGMSPNVGAGQQILVSPAALRVLQAELQHKVDLGSSPLSIDDLSSKLGTLKGSGKQLDAIINRYGNGEKAPPARIAAKAKMVADLAARMQF